MLRLRRRVRIRRFMNGLSRRRRFATNRLINTIHTRILDWYDSRKASNQYRIRNRFFWMVWASVAFAICRHLLRAGVHIRFLQMWESQFLLEGFIIALILPRLMQSRKKISWIVGISLLMGIFLLSIYLSTKYFRILTWYEATRTQCEFMSGWIVAISILMISKRANRTCGTCEASHLREDGLFWASQLAAKL